MLSAAALWVTAAGWADAARRRFGAAWVVSPGGVVSPSAALDYTRPRVEAARTLTALALVFA